MAEPGGVVLSPCRVLDTASESARRQLAERAGAADVLLWSARPAERPFDLDALAAEHPGLVVVALRPFGLDGPKAEGGADLPFENSGMFADVNTGKLGLELDLSKPSGREDLIVAGVKAVENGRGGRPTAVPWPFTRRSVAPTP